MVNMLKSKKIYVYIFSVTLLFLQFNWAIFDRQDEQFYSSFQLDSEQLVVNKINNSDIKNNGYGLKIYVYKDNAHTISTDDEVENGFYGFVCDNNSFVKKHYKTGNIIKFNDNYQLKILGTIKKDNKIYVKLEKADYDIENNLSNFNIYDKKTDELINRKEIGDYISQIGIQGFIFSFLYNKCHMSIKSFYFINNLLLSLILTVICVLVNKKTNIIFSVLMYVSFIFSPWITAFARNLYWIPFTWFLPTIFTLLYFENYKKRYCILIFLSILFKCLAGYEYVSTILVFALALPFAEIIKNKKQWKTIFKHLCFISLVMLSGFMVAIMIHARLRGSDLIEGIQNIFIEDVLRRTYGNVKYFDPVYAESLTASPITVLSKYIYCFNTDILFGIPSNLFPMMLIVSGVYSAYKFIKEKYFYSFLYYVMLLAPMSWFVLAKSHSYVHTHMNFVLWYFGFIAIMIYMIIIMIKEICNFIT